MDRKAFTRLYNEYLDESERRGDVIASASDDRSREAILEKARQLGVKPLLICVREENADHAYLKPGSKVINCEWCNSKIWCHRWQLENVVKICLQCADEYQQKGQGHA